MWSDIVKSWQDTKSQEALIRAERVCVSIKNSLHPHPSAVHVKEQLRIVGKCANDPQIKQRWADLEAAYYG